MKILLVQPSDWSPDGHANFDAIEELVSPGSGDLMLLPELAGASLPRADYLERVRALAMGAGMAVVGGSHYDGAVNRGAVYDAGGTLVAEYDKVHPYGVELRSGIVPGRPSPGFELHGRRLRALLCADLWYSASLAGHDDLDAVLVPAFSVTRWDGPVPRDARGLLHRHARHARLRSRARPRPAARLPAGPPGPRLRRAVTGPTPSAGAGQPGSPSARRRASTPSSRRWSPYSKTVSRSKSNSSRTT
ncbi:nitrilase-related carbon-nitrogen hydrolase [Nonomuraea jiangxiensis]|uniref:Carbon-nitrogen hydrolase n=1 Tax=Nonomuraea jiangxiensis TaxID=633440 RepID=A0A1G9J1C3_9ACTN|nr:nitrilase-related carbon-nitrogen hydrolase [Nonomuraea jiangxiensis]SDL31122.1 Carbon-nitrogen hydrolase [Nonomuraea jiangxiensis]